MKLNVVMPSNILVLNSDHVVDLNKTYSNTKIIKRYFPEHKTPRYDADSRSYIYSDASINLRAGTKLRVGKIEVDEVLFGIVQLFIIENEDKFIGRVTIPYKDMFDLDIANIIQAPHLGVVWWGIRGSDIRRWNFVRDCALTEEQIEDEANKVLDGCTKDMDGNLIHRFTVTLHLTGQVLTTRLYDLPKEDDGTPIDAYDVTFDYILKDKEGKIEGVFKTMGGVKGAITRGFKKEELTYK